MNDPGSDAKRPTDAAPSRYAFTVIRERMRNHPGPVLDSAIGRDTPPPPAPLIAFIESNARLAIRRADQKERDALTVDAAAWLAREYGVQVDPECILPAPGGRSAMSALIECLLDPGQTVLVTEPGYPAFARLAAQRRARVHAVPLDPDRAFAPDVGSIDRNSCAGNTVVALNYPNNPTGAMLTGTLANALRNALGQNALLFNDATYGPLTYEASPVSLLSETLADGALDLMIELHSFAKLFAIGPLAIAFLAGTPALIHRLRDYSDFCWTPLTALHVQVARQCAVGGDHVDRVRAYYAQRVAALREALGRQGFQPYPTPAGMYVLCRSPRTIGGTPVSTAADAADLLLDDYGIASMPWSTPGHEYLRFSSLYRSDELDAFRATRAGRPLACYD